MYRQQQIIAVHAAFITQVVQCLQSTERRTELEQLVKSAEDNGWADLGSAIRRIASGRRDMELLNGLDEEDQTIAEAILRGLQDPSTLPDPNAPADPAQAAPGLAHMIHAAGSGNPQALQLIADMAEQMSKAGGSMARLAAAIRPMINGEREPEELCKKMDSKTEQLVLGILKELERLQEKG